MGLLSELGFLGLIRSGWVVGVAKRGGIGCVSSGRIGHEHAPLLDV